ncbi:MAG TPA: ATP-binding protein, partial [Chloroflexia bacterium]|nr:ATP-binding protein [Chloroflexia bacterium]
AVAIDQVRQSAAERSQRAFFEKVLENFPGVLVVVSPSDLRVVRANRNFNLLLPEPYRGGEPVVGRTLRELSGQNWDERNEQMANMLRDVGESGEAVSFQQYETAAVSGVTTYWNWTAAPVDPLAEGEQRLVMFLAQDVTEVVLSQRKEQESIEAARARAEELETVIRQMVDGVIIFDVDGRIVKYNPAGELLLGRHIDVGADQSSSPTRYGLYTMDNQLYRVDQLPSTLALRGEAVVGAQMTVKRERDPDVIISVSGAPLRNPDGQITGAVVVMRDITQDKMAERLKDEFLSVVSHELRTPLSAIMGYSDLMLRGVHGALSEKQARALGAVRSNADRLLHLINDLLDVSRLESGSIPIAPEAVNLAQTIARTITQTKVLAVNAGVSVSNQVSSEKLPLVMADEPRLQQIIENLLTNAIKFTPSGGSVVFSAVASHLPAEHPDVLSTAPLLSDGADARSVVVTVTDTGAGLEGEQVSRIWERFYQVDTSAKRRSGGAGLGLAIVRNLVDLHGGQIQARSEGISRGTSFSFSLPLAPIQQSVAPPPATRRKLSDRPYVEDDPNAQVVLVVEDDEDQREIICDMLEMEGYKVVVAEDGEEAVSLAHDLVPAAIALDVMLPRSDGWEVLSTLKSDPTTQEIPVLIISVVDQQEFGRKLGADEYLIKPLDAGSLRTAVRRLIKEER